MFTEDLFGGYQMCALSWDVKDINGEKKVVENVRTSHLGQSLYRQIGKCSVVYFGTIYIELQNIRGLKSNYVLIR